MTEFLGQLHERQRSGFRRVAVLLALLSAAVLVLGYTLFARSGIELEPPLPAAAHPVAQAVNAPLTPPAPQVTATTTAPSPADGSSTSVTTPSALRSDDPTPKRRSARSSSKDSESPLPTSNQAAADALPPVPASPTQRSEARSPAPTHADVEFGFLTLDTSPWSQVSADGVSLGQTPIVRARLSAGPHTLVLVNSERSLSTTYQITIEAGKTTVRRLGLD